MPSALINLGAVVACSHGGRATPVSPSSRVSISGQPAVVLGMTYAIADCPLPPPPIGNGPCLSGQFLTGSPRVSSQGRPLVLSSSAGVCSPTGSPLVVDAAQSRVIGI